MYKTKKVLRNIIFILLFVFIGLTVWGYIMILPSDVQFTNVSSSAFTVSWSTRFPTRGTAIVVESKNKLPIGISILGDNQSYDTRDIRRAELESVSKTSENIQNSEELTFDNFHTEISVTKRGRYYTHHVEITGLEPEKEYSLMIGNSFLFHRAIDGNNSSVVKTRSVPKSIPTPRPAYGSILDAENRGDIPIQDLKKITDGILYINYLDKASEKRSSTVSGSLNEDGYWYVDMSNALNSEGTPFFEEYVGTETELSVEIQLNAGPLGRWKTTREEAITSPASPIIINVPDISTDTPNATVKISQDYQLVKGISAQNVGECAFTDYCGPCVYYQKGGECTCNLDKLKARNCFAGGVPQENTSCGNGIAKLGEVKKYNNECMVCTLQTQNGYYIGKFVSNNNYDPSNSCAPKQNKVQKEDNQLCDVEQGCYCLANKTNINQNTYCTDGIKSISNRNSYCEDRDGCECLNSEEEYVEFNKKCKAIHSGIPIGEDSGGPTEEGSGGPTEEGSGGPTDGGGVVTTSPTNPNLNNGDICRTGTILAGIWNADKKICEERTETQRLTEEQIKELRCWEGIAANEIYDVNANRYTCSYGHFVIASDVSGQAPCIENDVCKKIGIQCISSSGKLLKCQEANGKKWMGENLNPESFTVEFEEIKEVKQGEPCISNSCKCRNAKVGVTADNKYIVINYDEFCPEVATCNESNKGKVCNFAGNTCILKQEPGTYVNSYVCEGAPVSAFQSKGKNLMSVLGFKVYSASNKYMIDQSSGIVSGLKEGTYEIKYEDKLYMFTINEQQLNAQNGQILLYTDSNENGKYDEGVDKKISDLASQVEINQVNQMYKYKFTEGYNFVSFPFIPTDEIARTAAGMLEMLNDFTNGAVYSISKFDSSWKTVGKNQELYDNNDFQLVPGQGYIIKVASNTEVSIPGYPVKLETNDDQAPITLYQGWNLIGTYGSNVKQYTAKTLIQGINDFKPIDFTADNVSRWESDVQRYDGFQITNQNGLDIEYGFDFPINNQQAYFVRILNGKGNWQLDVASK